MQRPKVHNVAGHSCSLPKAEDIVTLYISSGVLVNFRRRLRKYVMVDATNPDTKNVLKSTAQIRLEERKHLRHHYFMVHPFSKARTSWEAIMIFIYFVSYAFLPLDNALILTPAMIVYTKFMCDIFTWIDIGFHFSTGYFDKETRKIVMHPKSVFKKYFFSFFWPDLLGSIPFNMYIIHTKQYHLRSWKFFILFRLLRVPTMIKYLEKFIIRMGLWSCKLKSVSLVVWMWIVIWWTTTITYTISADLKGINVAYLKENNPESVEMILDCLHDVIKVLTLTTISKFRKDNTLIVIYHIVCIYCGGIIGLMLFVRLEQIYRRLQSSKNNYDNLLQEVDHYMCYKELSTPLKKKILHFLDFKYQGNTFKENDIMNTLNRILKEEVLLNRAKKLIQNVDCFRGLSDALMLRVISKLHSEVYLPNDTIVKAGEIGNSMYFIYVGTVAVYTETNEEICHLEDGDHFGEISLIISEARVATVAAVTNCELFRLSRKDFSDALGPFPAVHERVKEAALSRFQKVLHHMSE